MKVIENESDYRHFLETLVDLGTGELERQTPSMTLKGRELDLATAETMILDARDEARVDGMIASLPQLSLERGDGSDFVVQELLGQGGMGVVYCATQRSLEREVAIKQVREDRRSPESICQLIHEARVAGALDHPAILPVHAFGLDEQGSPLLVMKRIRGESWEAHLGAPAADRAVGSEWVVEQLEVLMSVCRAVEFAHARGVIHRDIKPENVMLGSFGEVYLVDWGVAVKVDEQVPNDVGLYAVVGTPSYISPEVAFGQRADERSDVFLLGACLHELLVGQPRHLGPSLHAVLFKAVTCQPYDYPESVPRVLAEIANRACARAPEDRFESVAELYEALDDYMLYRNAIGIAREAEQKLVSVEQDLEADHGAVTIDLRTRRAQALFGFQQALQIWPESPIALDGIQRCHRAQVEIELVLGNLDSAREVYAMLDAPSAELGARIEARAEELTRARAVQHRRDRIARANDASTSSRDRLKAGVIIALLWAVVGFGAAGVMRGDLDEAGYRASVTLAWASFLAIVSPLVVLRRRIDWNSYNRRFVTAVLGASVTAPLLRMLGWALEIAQPKMLRVEMFVSVVLISLIVSAFQMHIWWAVAAYAGLLLFAAVSGYILLPYTIALVLIAGAFGWSAKRFHPDQGAPLVDE